MQWAPILCTKQEEANQWEKYITLLGSTASLPIVASERQRYAGGCSLRGVHNRIRIAAGASRDGTEPLKPAEFVGGVADASCRRRWQAMACPHKRGGSQDRPE